MSEAKHYYKPKEITFRPATRQDLLFISRGFHMAMLMDSDNADIALFAEKICSQEGVLYSPENTIIAEIPGDGEGNSTVVPVGMLTAYDGSRYHDMKVRTFTLVKEHLGIDFLSMDDEAVAGEYYLDSLAVLPPYRGRGIGRALLQEGIRNGRRMGIPCTTLVVDPANPSAKRLYESLGFRDDGMLFIFGHEYQKMALR